MSPAVTEREPRCHPASVVLSPGPPEQSTCAYERLRAAVDVGVYSGESLTMEWSSTEREPVVMPGEGQRLSLAEQQQLVIQYAPLVRRVARSLPLEIPGLLEFEDAVGYGTCGLVEAVRRYDPAKGTNFHAYAVRRIRGSMIDAFRRMDRLSRTMRQKARDVQRAQGELEVT